MTSACCSQSTPLPKGLPAGGQVAHQGLARHLAITATRQLSQLMEEVARHAAPADDQARTAGLTFLLARAWRYFQAAPATGDGIELHPAVAETAAELAARVHLHPDHLGKLFRRQMGLSVVAYRTRHRLERVAQAWHPAASFLHLALATGFGSYNRFHRAFTTHFGRSPRAWAAQQ